MTWLFCWRFAPFRCWSQMSRFVQGTEEVRDRKLSLMIQLSSSENKSWIETLTIKMMTYLMRSIAGDLDASTPSSELGPSDRTPFPVIPMARLGVLRHFGGALQESRDMPRNYVAATCDVDSAQPNFNIFARLLLKMMEKGILAKNVFDLTFLLAADQQDELPERAMATHRLVRVESKSIALPSAFVYGASDRGESRCRTWSIGNYQNFSRLSSSQELGRKYDWEGDNDQAQNAEKRGQSAGFQFQGKTRARADKLLEANKAMSMRSDDPVEKAVNELLEILDNIRVPIRRDQLGMYEFARRVPLSLLEVHGGSDGTLHDKDLLSMSILLLTTREDVQRHYIAANCNMKKAAVRIVETAAWRGQTFPIDRRLCRIELQSGQFFQQGLDVMGRPVFYFRNMGRGPSRNDVDASVAAVLHRLEAFHAASSKDKDCKCTLIVIMGRPYKELFKPVGADGVSSEVEEDGEDDMGASMAAFSAREHNVASVDREANPRVNPDESWQLHTSTKLIKQLVELVSAHYPERLHQALVVVKPSQTTLWSNIFGKYTLNNFVSSPETRSKVKFLNSFRELQKYVSKDELVTIAGGDAAIDPGVFGLEK
jgi:Divergent CRAL/TRIO domain